MKRFLILIIALIIAIPLALGSIAGLSYTTTTSSIVPRPRLTVLGTELVPAGYEWREPVFGGLIYKDFTLRPEGAVGSVGQLNDAVLPMVIPTGYTATASVTQNGKPIYEGDATGLVNYSFLSNGRYQMLLECAKEGDAQKGSGRLSYLFEFSVLVEPRAEISPSWVTQGDVLAIRVFNLQPGQIPTAECSLGPVTFLQNAEGQMTAYIPVNHDVKSATFPVAITLDGYTWTADLRSIEGSFMIQYEKQAEDGATPEELQALEAVRIQVDNQFNNIMFPLFDTPGDTLYWTGVFATPVQGNVVNEYGLFTYTNASPAPVRHTGIDIEASRGTQVTAPNGGVVVYTGYLDSTGNTVVLEHGGGLKSLFGHLSEISVGVGDVLAKGDPLGAVGSSGQASFSHLHYEVRLGRATLNPSAILSGTSNLSYFD